MTFFAPASITCFFSVHSTEDPQLSGSTGVGITLDVGARARAKVSEEGVRVNGELWNFPTVEYIIGKLGCDCGLYIEMDVPAGCGFGMSGASALASAFEINHIFNLKKSFFELADLAHEAEIVCRTGMGDVICQCFGGVLVRKKPGAPSTAVFDRFLWDMELDFLVLGPLSTQDLLKDNKRWEQTNRVGDRCLNSFLESPDLKTLFKLSRDFAVEAGLLDEQLEPIIERIESEGNLASMVMLGKVIYAYHGLKALQEYGSAFRASVGQNGVRRV